MPEAKWQFGSLKGNNVDDSTHYLRQQGSDGSRYSNSETKGENA